jgi:hypothetical protein
MGEMKVEHVLLFLVGAFLVYHMMGNCGCKRVEGINDCVIGRYSLDDDKCESIPDPNRHKCNKLYEDEGAWWHKYTPCTYDKNKNKCVRGSLSC